jgi:hypothetical protein
MDFEKLSYYTHLMKLPILVLVHMSFNENATKYRHVIDICPYMSSSDCSELKISIVDGAHPELKAMQFTRDNIMWCCGDDAQSTFEGFAFFSWQKTFKKITPPSWPGSEKWIKNICLPGGKCYSSKAL